MNFLFLYCRFPVCLFHFLEFLFLFTLNTYMYRVVYRMETVTKIRNESRILEHCCHGYYEANDKCLRKYIDN